MTLGPRSEGVDCLINYLLDGCAAQVEHLREELQAADAEKAAALKDVTYLSMQLQNLMQGRQPEVWCCLHSSTA